jgi:hypothetical protein
MGSNDLIAVTGIALTFFVSVANLIYSLRNNRRTTFVNTVTTSRLKWINSVRDAVSDFIGVTARLLDRSGPPDRIAELLLQRETLLHRIALHLNPSDVEDEAIKTLALRARELSEQGDVKGELSATLTELRNATGHYLKKEWSRVKDESGGR